MALVCPLAGVRLGKESQDRFSQLVTLCFEVIRLFSEAHLETEDEVPDYLRAFGEYGFEVWCSAIQLVSSQCCVLPGELRGDLQLRLLLDQRVL